MKVHDLRQEAISHVRETLDYLFPAQTWDEKTSLRTAERWLDFLNEYCPDSFSVSYKVEDQTFLCKLPFQFTTFPSHVDQMIVCNNIGFSSVCRHHLLPFYGLAHVAYVPHELQVGLSKIPRLVDWAARRPSTQEDTTRLIADEMKYRLKAKGVGVILKSVHTCMSCRGIRAVGAEMLTSEMRGIFLAHSTAKDELFNLLNLRGG
jgi:GTP cyclohydrolase I